MANKTLNLGCGELTYKQYPEGYECINMDMRGELEGIDVVGDVRDLSQFEDGSFDYILASDVVEHFPITQIPDLIKEWSRVLARFGILEIRTPSLHYLADHYMKHKDAKFISHHIFGGQDYPGNYHFVIFDPQWLYSICKPFGFEDPDVKEEVTNFVLKMVKKGGQLW